MLTKYYLDQALVSYQKVMDTFGPVANPYARRPSSRDSGVASSRGSSGVRLSVSSDFSVGNDCYDYIPGGWRDQAHERPTESLSPMGYDKGEDKVTQEGQSIPPQDIVMTGRTSNRYEYDDQRRSISRSSSFSYVPSSSFSSASASRDSLSKKASVGEVTLTEILAPPVLILTVLLSLNLVSSWGRILGLIMAFGLGKVGFANSGGVRERGYEGVDGRGRSPAGRSWRERE